MKKIFWFLLIFTLMNLCFIPLLALYGLSVCPILRIPGFAVGCAYAGSYIISVLLTNTLLIAYLIKSRFKHLPGFFQNRPGYIYVATYLFASLLGLFVLKLLLGLNHLTESRAPEILALASLVLGITQAYGLDWAIGGIKTSETKNHKNFGRSWLDHTFRTMAPIATAILILVHFLLIQSFLQTRKDLIPATTDEILIQTTYMILFVVAWLFLTYLFHFLSERDSALKVNIHLRKLEQGAYEFQSDDKGSWGLWLSLLGHLNSFSRVFGERTKLLKSFSRFVSDEVAQNALKQEINSASGREEELTVIMTDIRDFTTLAQAMKPEAVVALLNSYFTVMLDELVKHSIVVDKFIGDGILAYVEIDKSNKQKGVENQKAVNAAFGMLHRLDELNKEFQKEGLPQIKIGIGIYRGPLIKGNIGSSTKLQHTIIGDTVNRAARLESLCKELNVPTIITEEVWLDLNVESKNRFSSFSGRSVKGITEVMNVYGLRSNIL